MKLKYLAFYLTIGFTLTSSPASLADEEAHSPLVAESGSICTGFGPQTPRDIDNRKGENPQVFSFAPSYKEMNLCNIHFHNNAEHKARDYSILAGDGTSTGYQCNSSKTLKPTELTSVEGDICHGLKPGDTIEVHWVYSSCNIKPGKGLGACLSETCSNPDLRVESQVFTLVNDSHALNFNDFSYDGDIINNHPQANSLPRKTGNPIEFLGSTTGPAYSENVCSPLQVSWSVRPKCAKLDINSLGKWCEHNAFEEDHAHGVRKLVVNTKLLSKIR